MNPYESPRLSASDPPAIVDLRSRYTDRARLILRLAQLAARRQGRNSMAPEHILLGMIEENRGVAACILRDSRVDLSGLRSELEALQPEDEPLASATWYGKILQLFSARPQTTPLLPWNAQCLSLCIHAEEQVRQLGHDYVGSEHLLLGLLADRDSVPARILQARGISLTDMQAQLLQLLGNGLPPHTAP